MQLSLAPNLSFCSVEGRNIFLDRSLGRYFFLKDDLNTQFNRLVAGQPPLGDEPELDALLNAGIVGLVPGPALAPTWARPPTRSIFDDGLPRARMFDVVRLTWHEAATKHALSKGRFERQIDALAALKAPRRRSEMSLPRLCAAAGATGSLRSTYDQCLPRSLALTRWLRSCGHQAQLILGVTPAPFAAHAWVQRRSTILNDDLDEVRQFTPILVV